MKRLLFLAALLALPLSLSAQETAKTGFNFGPLPAIGYSTDMGFHYGVLSDVYYYGDGSVYPDYLYKMNFEVSAYTKGNKVLHSFFDSKYLIPGLRVSAAVSYFGNDTDSFYGFNGASSNYLHDLDAVTGDGLGFYLMKRDFFRIMTCLQGQIGQSHWGWAGGLTYTAFKTGAARNDDITQTPSLYNLYVDNGIIDADEALGGRHIELKAGVVYDTRDHENNPSRGTNLEVYFFGSKDFFQKRNDYLKLAVHFKQFHPLVGNKLVLGYHLGYQGLVAGKAPFYSLQTIQSLNMKQINTEGLGSTCTVRGTTANRFQGDGYAWGNLEFRIRLVTFDWINQHWALVLNPFMDAGRIVQPYRYDEMKAAAALTANQSPLILANNTPLTLADGSTPAISELLYTGNDEKIHLSAGTGLHVIMNQNFNISFEFAKAFDPQDGLFGMNVGLNYIF